MLPSRRILVNMIALYARIGVLTVTGLIGCRWVLGCLGPVDYGLLSLIAGVMGFLGFITSAMSAGIQRHLAFELGRGDMLRVKQVFSTALVLHLGMAALLVLLGETVGLWFLQTVLKVPPERHDAAFWVFQFTVFCTALDVGGVPFQAVLMAREEMVFVAIMGILQGLLILTLALLLGKVPGDHLIVYSGATAAILLAIAVGNIGYCYRRFPESRPSLGGIWQRALAGELASFAGWNLFGALGACGRTHGIAFVLNVFFGPAMNAAYGLANQVAGYLGQITQVFIQATIPRIVKHEGEGQRERMVGLALRTSKYAFLLTTMWLIPVLCELNFIFSLWLRKVPAHAVSFCTLVCCFYALDKLSIGLMSAVQAVGRIAAYQMTLGTLYILALPAAYLALRLGGSPESALWAAVATAAMVAFGRTWFARYLTGMPIMRWVTDVLVPCVLTILPGTALCLFLIWTFPATWWRLALVLSLGVGTMLGSMLVFGLDATERGMVRHGLAALADFLKRSRQRFSPADNPQ